MEQVALKTLKRGEYFRRKADAKTTFVRGDYIRETKRYSCDRTEDLNASIDLRGDTLVWVGFTY